MLPGICSFIIITDIDVVTDIDIITDIDIVTDIDIIIDIDADLKGCCVTRLRRPVGRLTVAEQKLEGEYRYVNSRLITNRSVLTAC